MCAPRRSLGYASMGMASNRTFAPYMSHKSISKPAAFEPRGLKENQ